MTLYKKNAWLCIMKSVKGMKTRLNEILSGSNHMQDQEVACIPQLLNIFTQLVFFNVNTLLHNNSRR